VSSGLVAAVVPGAPVRVVVNGAATWNLTARLDALPEPVAHTVFASSWAEGLGGTSAGKAVSLAALGAEVVLQTVLGADDAAARVRGALDRPGIEVRALPSAGGLSERHANLIDAAGNRVSVYLELPSPAARAERPPAVVGIAAAVLDLAGHSVPLLAAYRSAGIPVWCDVHDDDGSADGYARPFTAAADVVVASDVKIADVDAYLRARIVEGARLAVCTRGGSGSRALFAGDAGERWFDVGVAPVDTVVDTEGAGDAFVAGLLVALARGASVARALAEASAAGAAAVATAGLGAGGATPELVARLAEWVAVVETSAPPAHVSAAEVAE
jgi:sugar/nucleoside kinase (ribokinase family)